MGLREHLARLATRRVHVLLAEAPGWGAVRLVAEQQISRRGWVLAVTPADADCLLECGAPGPGMSAAVEAVWAQLPGPRARARVLTTDPAAVAEQLDGLARQLTDRSAQQADAAGRPRTPSLPDQGSQSGDGHDMGGGHGSGDGHDMGGMGPMTVAGLPLAERAPDRDGLALDVLHLRLGPVLAGWPAGLVVDATVQGDVINEVDVEVLSPGDPPPPPLGDEPLTHAVWACDDAGRLLELAGWAGAARRTRQARDLLIGARAALEADASSPDRRRREEQARELLARTVTGLGRSPLLRWLLGGLGLLSGSQVPGPLHGDVLTRLTGWYDEALAALAGQPRPVPRPDPGAVLALLPGLLTGLELGAARLVVASLGLHGRLDVPVDDAPVDDGPALPHPGSRGSRR